MRCGAPVYAPRRRGAPERRPSEREVLLRGADAGELAVLVDGTFVILGLAALPARAVKELHRVGHDAHRLTLLLVGGLPLAPLQPAVDAHAASPVHVVAHALSRGA